MDAFSGTFRSWFISGACNLKPAHHPLIPCNEGARIHLKMLTGSIYASWLQRERHLHASRLHQPMLPARHQNRFAMRSKTDGHPRKNTSETDNSSPESHVSWVFLVLILTVKSTELPGLRTSRYKYPTSRCRRCISAQLSKFFFFWDLFLGEVNPHFLFGAAAMVQVLPSINCFETDPRWGFESWESTSTTWKLKSSGRFWMLISPAKLMRTGPADWDSGSSCWTLGREADLKMTLEDAVLKKFENEKLNTNFWDIRDESHWKSHVYLEL